MVHTFNYCSSSNIGLSTAICLELCILEFMIVGSSYKVVSVVAFYDRVVCSRQLSTWPSLSVANVVTHPLRLVPSAAVTV